MNPSTEDTPHANTEYTPPPTTVQCVLCCDLAERDSVEAQAVAGKDLIPKREVVTSNTSAEHKSVTKRPRQLGRSQNAVQVAVALRKSWVSLRTLAAELPQLTSKALLMTLGRLVKQGYLEHRAGRSGKYRIKRERKTLGPRKRRARPFPVAKDGAERKTISRSELIDRGWSKDLIDALLPTKGLDFTVQRLPKPGTKRTSILAHYYWVSRVKDLEAQPWFEDKRFDLRRKQIRAASNPLASAPSGIPDPALPPRRPIQKASHPVNEPASGRGGYMDECA